MKKLFALIAVIVLTVSAPRATAHAAEAAGSSGTLGFACEGNVVSFDGDSVALSSVMTALDVSEAVTAVESGDSAGTLFEVINTGNDWMINSRAVSFRHSADNDVSAGAYSSAYVKVTTGQNAYVIYVSHSVAGVTSVSDCQVTVAESAAYTGSAITPPVTVSYNGTELVGGTDYSVTYENNVNVGTATVTIAGQGNYAGTKSVTFTIVQGTVTPAAVPNLVYNGQPQVLVTTPESLAGEIEYSLDGANFGPNNNRATDAGSYKVYYRIIGEGSVISKNGVDYVEAGIARLSVAVMVKGSTSTVPYDGNVKSVSGYSLTSNNSLYPMSTAVVFNGSDVATGTEPGTYDMGLTGKFSNNNENFNVSFNVTDGWIRIANKSLAGVIMQNMSFPYTGDYNPSYRPIMPDGSSLPSGVNVTYGLTANDITKLSSRQFKTVGSYKLYFKVSGEGYDEKIGSTTITITPIDAQLQWPAEYVSDASCKPAVTNLAEGDICNVVVRLAKSGNTITARVVSLSNPNYKLSGNSTMTYSVENPASVAPSVATTVESLGSSISSGSRTTGRTSGSVSSSSSQKASSSLTNSSLSSRLDSKDDAFTSDVEPEEIAILDEDDDMALSDYLSDNADSALTLGLGDLLSDDGGRNGDPDADPFFFTEDEELIKESRTVEDDTYASDNSMTYGRMAHLASPEGYPLIFGILITMGLMIFTEAVVFMTAAMINSRNEDY